MEIKTITLPESKQESNEYEYRLAVSSDGLSVHRKDNSLVQVIIPHTDKNGYLLEVVDENHLLELIDVLKGVIEEGFDALIFLAEMQIKYGW